MTAFNPGFHITADTEQLSFTYGENTFGPPVEQRFLDDIRKSLRDPEADGPEICYAVAMDVGKKADLPDLQKRSLLYGAMIYAKGRIGKEPVRSQGHVHAISPSCNASTAEVYEIWEGAAIIYMQETVKEDPGKCYAVYAKAGEVVIVPPNWAHYTVNADIEKNMVFGAWCIRDYGFEYDEVRAHGGLAYFPVLEKDNTIAWEKNETYTSQRIIEKKPRRYEEFGLIQGVPIYTQYEKKKDLFDFVTKPDTVKNIWRTFEP